MTGLLDQKLVRLWMGLAIALFPTSALFGGGGVELCRASGASESRPAFHAPGWLLVRHDLPDGFVERSTAVLIRDRLIKIEYAVGLSAGTMRSLLAQWNEPFEGGWDQPDVDDETVRSEFIKRAPGHLMKGLKLRLDEHEVELEVERAERSSRHHYDLELSLRATLPERPGMWRMDWDDENFLDLDGAVRKACKAAGRSLLIRSNAAPIIVRAERVELGKLPSEKRRAAVRIQATVKWMGPPEGNDSPHILERDDGDSGVSVGT